MKKKRALLFAWILILAALGACAQKKTPGAAAAAAEPTVEQTVEPATGPSARPAEVTSESESQTDETLADILTNISVNYHGGTAGCSLSAAKYAGEILDWSVTVDNASDEAQKTAQQVFASLDAGNAAEFGDKISDIYAAAQLLCGDSGKDLLESCGYEAQSFPWSQTDMEAVFTALSDAVQTSGTK